MAELSTSLAWDFLSLEAFVRVMIVCCVAVVICDLHWHVSWKKALVTCRNATFINNGLQKASRFLPSYFKPSERQSDFFLILSTYVGVSPSVLGDMAKK